MKKRADGRYLKQVLIGYNPNGKPKYKNIYGHSQADVNRRAELLKAEIEKGTAVLEDITVGQWSERWFSLYKANSSVNTQNMYRNIINVHIQPTIGNLKLISLKPHHIQTAMNNLISEGKNTTARQFRMTIRQILKAAVENNYVAKNVADNIQPPKSERLKKRALSENEKNYVNNANFTPKQRAFISLIYYAGLRRGEALALKFDDFDLKNKHVNILRTMVFDGNNVIVKPMPKTDAGIRSLPLPDKLIDALFPHMSGMCSGELLFTMNNGEPITKSSFRKFWNGIIKELQETAKKIDGTSLASDITPHIFRHTYATSLYYAGIDIKTAQYLLGHASIQMTLDVYTHLERLENSNIADKLNTLFK